MASIMTVLGALPPRKLGHCQCHEHLSIVDAHNASLMPDTLRIDDTGRSAGELTRYREAGGGAVVDAQPLGCGRDARMLEEISRRSGVHIVASTGFHRMMYYPDYHWIFTRNADELAELFIRELTAGMYVTADHTPPRERLNARAGQIKTALDEGEMTGQVEKLYHAASVAAVETGAPLMAHIEKGSDPVRLADFLERQGVDLNHVIFCHMDHKFPDLGVHREICSRGIYLEYDGIARPDRNGDEREAEIVAEMMAAGYTSRLLISMDTTRKRLSGYGGGPGLCNILKGFIPLLTQRGATPAELAEIFRENPARVLAWEPDPGRCP